MITVFGSINLDLVVRVDRLPVRGETAAGLTHESFPGGKGGNQALSARTSGADVKFVGAVGEDAFAALALANLDKAGVDLEEVHRLETETGLAMIGVEAGGENQIIVASGANAKVSASWLDAIPSADTLLLQGELLDEETIAAMKAARRSGARIIWNPAPVQEAIVKEALPLVDVLIVNQGEAIQVADVLGLPREENALLDSLKGQTELVVVTRGAGGILAARGDERFEVRAPEVTVLDTTGAGDAFCGALAAALDRGETISECLAEAMAAGALACTRVGAQSLTIERDEIGSLAATILQHGSA